MRNKALINLFCIVTILFCNTAYGADKYGITYYLKKIITDSHLLRNEFAANDNIISVFYHFENEIDLSENEGDILIVRNDTGDAVFTKFHVTGYKIAPYLMSARLSFDKKGQMEIVEHMGSENDVINAIGELRKMPPHFYSVVLSASVCIKNISGKTFAPECCEKYLRYVYEKLSTYPQGRDEMILEKQSLYAFEYKSILFDGKNRHLLTILSIHDMPSSIKGNAGIFVAFNLEKDCRGKVSIPLACLSINTDDDSNKHLTVVEGDGAFNSVAKSQIGIMLNKLVATEPHKVLITREIKDKYELITSK